MIIILCSDITPFHIAGAPSGELLLCVDILGFCTNCHISPPREEGKKEENEKELEGTFRTPEDMILQEALEVKMYGELFHNAIIRKLPCGRRYRLHCQYNEDVHQYEFIILIRMHIDFTICTFSVVSSQKIKDIYVAFVFSNYELGRTIEDIRLDRVPDSTGIPISTPTMISYRLFDNIEMKFKS